MAVIFADPGDRVEPPTRAGTGAPALRKAKTFC
jgi:hypothetical protein